MSAEPVISSGDLELMVHATCVRGLDKTGPAFATTAPLQERYIDFTLLIEPPLPSATATITDLCNEPLFTGYMSSEEDMSSSDNSSLSSINSSTFADDFGDDFFETNFPEMLAEDCTFVEQAQCDKAEVITLISPGKPKMVRVSRVDLSASSSPIIKRPTTSLGEKHTRNSPRLSIVSLRAHSHTAAVASPKLVSPKMPSTPELEIGSPQTSVSSHGPGTPESPASAYFDAPTFMTTPCPKTHRMSRNGYHLELPRAIKRPGSSQSMEVPLSAPLTVPSFFGFGKPKMLPRGASERMASLDLPPYPREFVQQPSKNRWTLRKDSVSSVSSKDTPRFRLRRAESGLLPSWG